MHLNIRQNACIPTYAMRPTLAYFDFHGRLSFINFTFIISTLHTRFIYQCCILCFVFEIFHYIKLENYKCSLRLMKMHMSFVCLLDAQTFVATLHLINTTLGFVVSKGPPISMLQNNMYCVVDSRSCV